MKTIIGKVLNRHTFRKGGDAGTSEAKTAAEEKAKAEEKALVAAARGAKAANRYTWKLINPQDYENKGQKNF